MEKNISLNDVYACLFEEKKFNISASSESEVKKSYEFLKEFSKNKVIYGINTGFGPMAQYKVDDQYLKNLQYNIIRSHSTGAGEPLSALNVKAAMIARMGTFLRGKSGVNIELPLLLKEFINRDIIPYVPRHGSVGASGDLVQLAHMTLPLIGEGFVYYKGEKRNASDVLKECGLKPMQIYIREGLSATNGTSFMTGIGSVNLYYANRLTQWAIIASVMMNEIASSHDDLMSEVLNDVRPHRGQIEVARIMREISAGSKCLVKREVDMYNNAHNDCKVFENKHKVQAYYSLRCVPQIIGPIMDTLDYAADVIECELNSACDNPIVDPDTQNVYHGGNFHGDYISMEMDKIKIGITKTAVLAERQMNYLFHDRINGILPPFVNMGTPGLNYGMQAAQFTATSTTAECQTLSNSMYVHSIPNNNDNQDVVSMGTNSALLCQQVIDNAFQVVSIHYMSLMQAVDCLKIADKLSPFTRDIYDKVRAFFPKFILDKPLYEDIAATENFLRTTRPLK